jgi:hypothetical protein
MEELSHWWRDWIGPEVAKVDEQAANATYNVLLVTSLIREVLHALRYKVCIILLK